MQCKQCGRITHQHGALVGMMGLGFLAASFSEYLGEWVGLATIVAAIVGGVIGWSSDRKLNAAEKECEKSQSE